MCFWRNSTCTLTALPGLKTLWFIGFRISRPLVRAGVLRYRKEFEVVIEQYRRPIRLVRTLNFQFPILAHFLYAAERVGEIDLRGEFQSFWPKEISPKLLVEVYYLNKLRRCA